MAVSPLSQIQTLRGHSLDIPAPHVVSRMIPSLQVRATIATPAPSSSSSFPPPPPPPPSSSSMSGIPKMEPFNRSRISRLVREPSLLEKAENAVADRCTMLEGDDAYRCWEALFEFENLKEEYTVQCDVASSEERSAACRPLERLENLVRQSSGVASLIENVRVIAKGNKMRKQQQQELIGGHSQGQDQQKPTVTVTAASDSSSGFSKDLLEPGSLPPSEEELELERSSRMPESPFTRLLRKMGSPSSWSSQSDNYEAA